MRDHPGVQGHGVVVFPRLAGQRGHRHRHGQGKRTDFDIAVALVRLAFDQFLDGEGVGHATNRAALADQLLLPKFLPIVLDANHERLARRHGVAELDLAADLVIDKDRPERAGASAEDGQVGRGLMTAQAHRVDGNLLTPQ